MKRYFLPISALSSIGTVILSATYTIAASSVTLCPDGGFKSLCDINPESSGNSLIFNIVSILLVLAAIASLFFLIYGGIRWILSGGDKAKVGEARATLTAAVVGLIITFLSFFILNIVLGIFGLDSNTIFKIPRLVNN